MLAKAYLFLTDQAKSHGQNHLVSLFVQQAACNKGQCFRNFSLYCLWGECVSLEELSIGIPLWSLGPSPHRPKWLCFLLATHHSIEQQK